MFIHSFNAYYDEQNKSDAYVIQLSFIPVLTNHRSAIIKDDYVEIKLPSIAHFDLKSLTHAANPI